MNKATDFSGALSYIILLSFLLRNQTQFATHSATQSRLWMLWESILLFKILLESHRPYDKKWPFGRYSLTVETTSSSFDTRWGNYDRKVNSWPLRPPLRSYQLYRNQRVCSPRNHLSVRHTKWRDNRCYAIHLNLLRALLRNRAYESFLSPFCYIKSC